MTHLSRITLADGARAGAGARPATVYAHHQQVWRFYDEDRDAERDFLYRFDMKRDGPRFHTVSARPPMATIPGWRVETRPYEPVLERGAILRFSLRANPTKRTAEAGKRSDGRRHDVVMLRKHEMRSRGEDIHMATLVKEAGLAWLTRQGERHGFAFDEGAVRADGYHSHRFPRPSDGREISVTGIDFEGILRVTDPSAFAAALRGGIGPAKGFGFGLLLVRRP